MLSELRLSPCIILMRRFGGLYRYLRRHWNGANDYRFRDRYRGYIASITISSLFNIITLIFGVFLRCLIGYDIDLTYNSLVFCKIRFYFIFTERANWQCRCQICEMVIFVCDFGRKDEIRELKFLSGRKLNPNRELCKNASVSRP